MNNFRDTRLIEAFEYIDPKYINEVGAGLKLRSVYSVDKEYAKPTLRTHLKQLTILAACVLLFALVFPTFSYVANLIADFTAGAGTTDDPLYLPYLPDLEPLSKEMIDEINEEFIPFYLKMSKEELIADYGEDYAHAEKFENLRVLGKKDYYNTPYYGTFGGCIFFAIISPNYGNSKINVAGCEVYEHTYAYHYSDKTMYYIKDAYAAGIVAEDDIELVLERQTQFFEYKKEHEKNETAELALTVTEQTYTNTDTGEPDADLPTGIRVWDWYHPDDSERYPYFSVSLPEFNNVTIERNPEDCMVYVDGVHLLGGAGYGCSSFYLSDLTGDGYPELCFVMNCGSGIVDHRIVIIDYTIKETVFTAIGRMYRDYYLFLRNGVLCVKETEYAKQEPIRTGVLKHNGSEITIIWDSEANATVDRDPIPQPGESVS